MMTDAKQSNKKVIIAAVIMLVVIALMATVFFIFKPKPQEGSKSITIEVVNKSKESTVYELKTDAEYLRQAMEEAEGLEFDGTEDQYGIMLSSVNGEVADFSVDSSYWSIMVNGEYGQYGIDTQPVYDGDAFQLVYTISEW